MFITHYPRASKPFYMKTAPESLATPDRQTVSKPSLDNKKFAFTPRRANIHACCFYFLISCSLFSPLPLHFSLQVECFDLIIPGVGELIGGSVREERTSNLLSNMSAHGLDPALYSWYVDLRKFGTVPHAGFGLGFERLLRYVTGMANIRDLILVPRTPGAAGGNF